MANGTYEEFLEKMSYEDKCSLETHIELSIPGFFSETPLTPEEQMYLSIIQSSIDKDILNEALSQGFSSIEAWREHNSRIVNMHVGNGIDFLKDIKVTDDSLSEIIPEESGPKL